MSQNREYSRLAVQDLPSGGILVRFTTRKLLLERDVQQMRDELESLLAPERIMLIDLSEIEYISSSALGVLLSTQRLLRKMCGAMTLCGIQPDIEEVFRICRLDRVFEIYADLESALGENSSDDVS